MGLGKSQVAVASGWSFYRRDDEALSGKRRILKDLNFQVKRGEKILVAGPSGCGKSTLLYALAGLDGRNDNQWQEGSLEVSGLRSTGLVQQDPESALILDRVDVNVAFGPENLAIPQDRLQVRVADGLAAAGLRVDGDHPTEKLSGGQKQRLGIAGVVAMRPEFMLLDEPTAHLDSRGVTEVRNAALTAVAKTGATLIVAEHRIATWYEHVDRMLVLSREGAIVADGPPNEVLNRYGGFLRKQGVWLPGFVPTAWQLEIDESLAVTPSVNLKVRGLKAGKAAGLPCRPVTPWGRRRYRKKLDAVPLALEGIDFDAGNTGLYRNIVYVSGDNGVGKTTFALSCASLLAATAGDLALEIDGSEMSLPALRNSDVPHNVGMVFQDPEHQFITGSVADEIRYGMRPRTAGAGSAVLPEAQRLRLYRFLASRLSLEHCQGRNPYTLSEGEKRRLALAAVLAARPKVLILDEPTSGQDSITWQQIVSLCLGLAAAGMVLIVISHDERLKAELLRRNAGEYHIENSATHDYAGRDDTGDGDAEAWLSEGSNNVRGVRSRDNRYDRRRPIFLASLNPLTKVAMMSVFSATAMISLDWLTACALIVAQLMLVPLSGLRARDFVLWGVPLAVGAAVTWFSTAVLAPAEGKIVITVGWHSISEGAVNSAFAITARMIAVALAGCCLIASTATYDLGAALARWLKLPQAFVFGALAAMRLFECLAAVWKTLSMGRRSRGVEPGKAAQAVPFLVSAIRRAVRVADTMEALGMDAGGVGRSMPRTWLRPSTFSLRDALMLLFSTVTCAAIVVASMNLGMWRPVWG